MRKFLPLIVILLLLSQGVVLGQEYQEENLIFQKPNTANSSTPTVSSTPIVFKSSAFASDNVTRYGRWLIYNKAASTWGRGDLVFENSTDGGAYQERLRITNTGKLGIGVVPSKALEIKDGSILIKSDVYADIKIERNNGGHITMGVTSGSEEAFISTAGQFKILTQGESTPRLFLDETGKLGLGTKTPTQRLDVQGNIRLSGDIHTSFSWALKDKQYENDIFRSGWESGTGDFIAIKHSGNNDEAETYGLRIGDGKGLEFGKNNFQEKYFTINKTGKVGIGTQSPDELLTVDGNIHSTGYLESTEVIVRTEASTIPDYVFQPDYDLMSLEEVEAYVKANSHLPEVPSAEEVEANGHKLAEMNLLLLKKIEELTLHSIRQEKLIKAQKSELKEHIEQEKQTLELIKVLESRIEKLEEK